MAPKRMGIMGCGTVADYGHAPAIRATAGLELHAVLDPDRGRAQAFAAKFGVPQVHTDPAAFLASGLDAVAVTSPAPCHLENVLAAAAQGKDILCEKPLSMDPEEGQRMVAAAATAGVLLVTGFDYRFSPASQTIRRLVREGAVGEVRSLRLIYIWNLHGRWTRDAAGQRLESPRRVGRMLEGGPMVDCGVHQIDLARWWLGSDVVSWTAAGAWVEDYDAPDHMTLHLDHANGAHTMVEISYSYCHTALEPVNRFTYELIGTDGVIRYDRGQALFEVRSSRGTLALPFSPEKNFQGMYTAFAEALGSRQLGDLPTGADGVIATRLAREATEFLIARRRAARPRDAAQNG